MLVIAYGFVVLACAYAQVVIQPRVSHVAAWGSIAVPLAVGVLDLAVGVRELSSRFWLAAALGVVAALVPRHARTWRLVVTAVAGGLLTVVAPWLLLPLYAGLVTAALWEARRRLLLAAARWSRRRYRVLTAKDASGRSTLGVALSGVGLAVAQTLRAPLERVVGVQAAVWLVAFEALALAFGLAATASWLVVIGHAANEVEDAATNRLALACLRACAASMAAVMVVLGWFVMERLRA